jgi:hypothetical protein
METQECIANFIKKTTSHLDRMIVIKQATLEHGEQLLGVM